MNTKPISPKLHGIIDYAFAGTLLLLPSLLHFNKKARKLYKLIGLEVLAYSALTDYPAGLEPVISFDTHHKTDCANIAGLAAVTTCKYIHKDKAILAFHTGMTAMAMITVLLTDWKAQP
jgi:hypothetical protein